MKKVNLTPNKKSNAFTIVELLVVIVVIGVLAAITIVSYTGITSKAAIATINSDLSNAKQQFAMYYVEHGVYPTGLDTNNCPTSSTSPSPDTNYCLKPSSGNTFALTSTDTTTTSPTYSLTATKDNLTYKVTESTAPTLTTYDWITIGNQTWSKTNLNTGTMVTSTTEQTNNSIIEKYCYNNDEANCTANGGFYQWNEAMQYATAEGSQGICPTGSHIPTDNDWKILEMQLGMTQEQADLTNAWRGTDQGTQLKAPNGSSGLNVPLVGYRSANGSFYSLSSNAYLWSSSESSASAWRRYLYSGYATVARYTSSKAHGFSVRCLGN